MVLDWSNFWDLTLLLEQNTVGYMYIVRTYPVVLAAQCSVCYHGSCIVGHSRTCKQTGSGR